MKSRWDALPVFSNYLDTGIILLCDSRNEITGAVRREDSSHIVSIGIIQMQAIKGNLGKWNMYPIWVITDFNGKIIGWLDSESLSKYCCESCAQERKFFEAALSSLPAEITIVDHKGEVFFLIRIQPMLISKIFPRIYVLLRRKKSVFKLTQDKNKFIMQTNVVDQNKFLGIIQIAWESKQLEKALANLDSYTNLALDLKAVFETSYDVIYVSDGNGITLRVSSACETLWGLKAQELVGKSVYELEKEGVYKPSITRLVLERKERVQAIQVTKTGRRLMVVGTPIKDNQGNVIRVINTSRDITQEGILQSELESVKGLMEGYKRELEQLRQLTMKNDQLIFRSEHMQKVVTLAQKVAEVDSTVLILGETGVGKEVIASFIHQNSLRKDKPFIKINCGAIPESLLESELFGYERGAFTGASKDGKLGLFELANGGTLFLNEIGELPISLQVKLLRVLQENELVRLGGSKPVKINVRLIAATNRDLEAEMRKGNFREDLFYRLNVIPIQIKPLRERKEDILPLAIHFITTFNRKNNKNKHFAQETLEQLQNYDWPGNVRELQNIIERLIVITDKDIIEPEHLPNFLRETKEGSSEVLVTGIIPLKKAIDMLETQLLKLARDKYKTTTQIAEILQVDQSTISRKLKKLGRI